MKKDIERPKVKNVAIAVVKETDGPEPAWGVYLINEKEILLTNVLVSSRGYGLVDGQEVKTSQLRHFLEDIEPMSFAKVEVLVPEVFGLTNQYLLSFYIDQEIYDKKYIFLAESIIDDNLVNIPLINRPGVLIR
ncbi:MAG: hypothetical protein ACI85F_000370 [Bacteroidia bacterium]|jgi:hypothetical protein